MTASPTDLDDLKQVWQQIDRRLAAHHALAVQTFRDGRVTTLRRRLWPLAGGQALQMALGVALTVAGIYGWRRHLHAPHLVVAGGLVQAYGLALILAAGQTIGRMRGIDYAAPVVVMQRQLGDLRRWHVRAGVWLGQAWWFLWMPCVMIAAAALGGDVWHRAPRVIAAGVVIGVAGVLLTELAARLSRRPGWAWLAALNDDAMAGASLRRAEAVLDEIRRFEDDDAPPAA